MNIAESLTQLTRKRRIALFLCLLSVVYGGALWYKGGLAFPIYADETQFWDLTRFFALHWPPSFEEIRSYPEPMTPLSFLIWGTVLHLIPGGIAVERAVNLLVGIAILCMMGLRARKGSRDPMLAALGLVAFPYFVPLSIHLYTDMLAALFVFLGFWYHVRERAILSALFFVLAIATRQYMVAFPAALGAYELLWLTHSHSRSWKMAIPQLLAASSLLGWILFFGGLGPTAGLERWSRHTISITEMVPSYGLYFLSCVGVYFVLPEFLFFSQSRDPRGLLTRRNGVLAAILLLLFVLFPPNFPNIGIESMGPLNRGMHLLLPHPALRVGLYYLLALLTCIRFARLDLGFWLLITNVLIVMNSWSAWEKYDLPILVALWYLTSSRPGDRGDIGQPILWTEEE